MGWTSILSGAAVLIAPWKMARLFALPPRAWERLLGVRDIAIGALLVGAPGAPVGFAARGVADACDVALMAGWALKRRRSLWSIAGRLAGGVLSSALAFSYAARG